jgi:hypothetical protein
MILRIFQNLMLIILALEVSFLEDFFIGGIDAKEQLCVAIGYLLFGEACFNHHVPEPFMELASVLSYCTEEVIVLGGGEFDCFWFFHLFYLGFWFCWIGVTERILGYS